jgi:hypothetical protein
MDETDATASAMVIAFSDEVSLRVGATELTQLADDVAHFIDPVGIPSYGLLEATDKLWHTDNATKEKLVQALEAEATMLKGEATSWQNNLCQSVARLVRECFKSPLLCNVGVLALSDKVWYVTSVFRVHWVALGEAREAVTKVGEDATARTQVLAELVKVTTELEEAADPRLVALVRRAANLALACQEHMRVADAVLVMRRATEDAQAHQEHRRRTAEATSVHQGDTARAWWPQNRWIGRDDGTLQNLEKELLIKETESTLKEKQTHVRIWGGWLVLDWVKQCLVASVWHWRLGSLAVGSLMGDSNLTCKSHNQSSRKIICKSHNQSSRKIVYKSDNQSSRKIACKSDNQSSRKIVCKSHNRSSQKILVIALTLN